MSYTCVQNKQQQTYGQIWSNNTLKGKNKLLRRIFIAFDLQWYDLRIFMKNVTRQTFCVVILLDNIIKW